MAKGAYKKVFAKAEEVVGRYLGSGYKLGTSKEMSSCYLELCKEVRIDETKSYLK